MGGKKNKKGQKGGVQQTPPTPQATFPNQVELSISQTNKNLNKLFMTASPKAEEKKEEKPVEVKQEEKKQDKKINQEKINKKMDEINEGNKKIEK